MERPGGESAASVPAAAPPDNAGVPAGRCSWHNAAMTSWLKPTAPPVGRIYEDGLSTEELRAALEVEGVDVVAGSLCEVHARMHRLIDEISARKRSQ